MLKALMYFEHSKLSFFSRLNQRDQHQQMVTILVMEPFKILTGWYCERWARRHIDTMMMILIPVEIKTTESKYSLTWVAKFPTHQGYALELMHSILNNEPDEKRSRKTKALLKSWLTV